jgi:hypothetical protein
MLPPSSRWSSEKLVFYHIAIRRNRRGNLIKKRSPCFNWAPQLWAMGWTIGVLGFDSRQGIGIFLLTTASRTALGPTQPPIQWVPGSLSLEVKRSGREADHSPPSSAEVKNAWSYTSTPPIRLHGVMFSWAQEKLYLYNAVKAYGGVEV